ncbi:hypothetical protein EV426DRAFT_705740 [Tirmania nivea]|nr:hypothetical protein EV426DRAFT_705740 [Tirmania nivea]
MEDYNMRGVPDDCLLLPASPVQLMECPVDPFLERLTAAGFAAGFDEALDETGARGMIRRCLPLFPLLPSESMEKGTAEDGSFEDVDDDDDDDDDDDEYDDDDDDDDNDDDDDDDEVGVLPGKRYYGRKTRELPPRPPSRVGMAGDFLIFDEQEGDGADDEDPGRSGGLEDEADEYEQPRKRGRNRNRDVLPGNAYASPPSPTPRGPRTRTRARIHRHRGRAPRTYTSAALRGGGGGASREGQGSRIPAFPPLQPLLPLPLAPSPSQMTPPPQTKRTRDNGSNDVRWPELNLDDYDIPSPPTARPISSSSTSAALSRYAYSPSDKENKSRHHSSPVDDDDDEGRDGDYPDADPMDISPPSPELPRSRASSRTLSPPPVETDSGSSIDTSTSSSSPSPSSSSNIDTSTSSSSSGECTSEDDHKNGRRAGPSALLQSRASTSFTCPKPPGLQSIHSSAAASIKRDCTSLIKEVLLPQVASPTSTNHASIFTTSDHFQRHLRTCFASFIGNLTTWRLALQNALHASPPKGRITLPGYLTLVPAYPHLILELNTQFSNSVAFNSTSTPKTSRPCLPISPPQTPIYALSKLVLAELSIAAYLAEVEMYSRTLALPVQSKSADLVRQKLLQRVNREASEGVEEAHGLCTMMWKGEWGLGGGDTEVDEEGEAERKRRRTSGVLKEYNEVFGREREGRKDRKWREREECAREFTWWWEEGRNG